MITYNTSAVMFNNQTPTGACCNTSNNTLCTVDGQFFRVFNLTTLAQLVSASITSSPSCVALINSASALVGKGGATTIDFIEVATGYKQSISGATQTTPAARGTLGGDQMIAADTSLGIAFGLNANGNVLNLIKASDFTVTTITIADYNNPVFESIILKSPGRWLAGSNVGTIYEIDSSGAIQDQFTLSFDFFPQGREGEASGTAMLMVYQMAYSENLLYITTTSHTVLMDWSTKTILKARLNLQGTGGTPLLTLSNPASGIALATTTVPTAAGQSVILELDLTVQPLTVRDRLNINSAAFNITSIGINPVNQLCWAIRTDGTMYSFSVAPRDSATKTIFITDASSGGVNQQGRLLILDDTASPPTVLLDTYMQSPATYRIPTNKTLMEVTKTGWGANAVWDISRYTS